MTRWIIGLALLIAVALIAVYRPLFNATKAHTADEFDLAALVTHGGEGAFEAIETPWKFRFPADHGGHRGYRTETWQVSGVLETADGRRLGLQFAVARVALDRPPPESDPGWKSPELFAGLLVLTDPGGAGLLTAERLARAGPGLAGWQADPLRLWIEDWSVSRVGPGDRTPDLELQVGAEEFALSLRLQDRQGLVSAEDLTADGSEGRPPFVFYVQPRLAANGRLRQQERVSEVSGSLSIEHAWGELPLPGGPLVRDRFSFYLDDGRVLMLVRSHRRDGSGVPSAFGLVAHPDGTTSALGDDDIKLRPLAPRSADAVFPLRWKLDLPDESIDLEFDIDGQARGLSGPAPSLSGVLRLNSPPQAPGGFGFAHLEGSHN